MCNVIQVGEESTPCKLRFGEDFKGPKIPFGCQADYWTGPRKKPKQDPKYEPTSKPGVFLGYVVHPGFDFRTEFVVASLQDIKIANYADKVNVLRVIKINEPEVINFCLRERHDGVRDGRVQAPIEGHEVQSPCGSRSPDSGEVLNKAEPDDPFSKNPGKRAVYNPGWLAFMQHV